QAEAEVRVVVTRDRLHVLAEAVRRLRIPACVELRPGQGLTDAAGAGLRFRGPFQQLGGRGGASPAHPVPTPTGPPLPLAPGGPPALPGPAGSAAGGGGPALAWGSSPEREPEPPCGASDICADPSVRRAASSRPRAGTVPRAALCAGPGQRSRGGHVSTVRRD